MKKHNRQYAFRMVELPFESGKVEFVQEGLYKWLMQHRYKCDWRIPHKGARN